MSAGGEQEFCTVRSGQITQYNRQARRKGLRIHNIPSLEAHTRELGACVKAIVKLADCFFLGPRSSTRLKYHHGLISYFNFHSSFN
jgi:hypothetical protein